MNTRLDTNSDKNLPQPPAHTPEQPGATTTCQDRTYNPDLLFLLGAIIAALIPLIILALQLDVITDEVVYLFEGKVYLPLLKHLDVGSNSWTQSRYNYEHPPRQRS